MNSEKGNALFLILIAVALFAALSYAVTQSGRSGSGIDKEQIIIKAAQVVEQGSLIKTHIQRLYWINEVDQVRMNSSAYDAAGTVYDPDGGTSTGRTVGVFNSDDGTPLVYPPIDIFIPQPPANEKYLAWQIFFNSRAQISGTDVGTTAGDEILALQKVSKAICEQINKSLTGSTAIASFSFINPYDKRLEKMNRDGTLYTSSSTTSFLNIGLLPGCSVSGTEYFYFDVIKEN